MVYECKRDGDGSCSIACRVVWGYWAVGEWWDIDVIADRAAVTAARDGGGVFCKCHGGGIGVVLESCVELGMTDLVVVVAA